MKNVVEALKTNAEKKGDKRALVTDKETLTYAQLLEKSAILCGYLVKSGIQEGDRVIIEAIPEACYVEAYYALQMAGAVTIPVEKGIDIYKLYYLVKHMDVKMIIGDGEQDELQDVSITYEKLMAEADKLNMPSEITERNSQRISEIVLTVGTSGIAKAAMHSERGIACMTDNSLNGVGTKADDVVLIPLPMNHAFGLRTLRSTLTAGGCAVLLKDYSNAETLIDIINENGCTAMSCIPETMENALRQLGNVRAVRGFKPLRYIEFGAGAVPAAMREKLTVILPHTDILNTWGSPETGGCLFVNVSKRPEKLKSAGHPLQHITLGIFSCETGQIIEDPGEYNRGLLAIKGDMIFKGYLNNEEEYNNSVQDGWFITDDMAWKDEDGYYYIIGRVNDIMKIENRLMAPNEIENAVYNLPEIKECACFGVEDVDNPGNDTPILIYVENLDRKADEEKIIRTISESVEACMVPKTLIKVYGIPKTFIKKVDRKLIRKIYLESGVEGLRSL